MGTGGSPRTPPVLAPGPAQATDTGQGTLQAGAISVLVTKTLRAVWVSFFSKFSGLGCMCLAERAFRPRVLCWGGGLGGVTTGQQKALGAAKPLVHGACTTERGCHQHLALHRHRAGGWDVPPAPGTAPPSPVMFVSIPVGFVLLCFCFSLFFFLSLSPLPFSSPPHC